MKKARESQNIGDTTSLLKDGSQAGAVREWWRNTPGLEFMDLTIGESTTSARSVESRVQSRD